MKIHHQWMPDRLLYEQDLLSPDTKDTLQKMGHSLKAVNYLGRLMGIVCLPEQNIYEGVADSSSPDGGAIGY